MDRGKRGAENCGVTTLVQTLLLLLLEELLLAPFTGLLNQRHPVSDGLPDHLGITFMEKARLHL